MIYVKSSQWTFEIWIMKVSGLGRFGLGMLVDLPNLDQKIYAMRITCIIIRIILHTTHNILHIAHNIFQIAHIIFHFIRSYAMRPWNHGLNIRTFQNEGSTYGTSTREPSLANTQSVSFIHMYFISFHSQASVNTSYTQDVV